MKLSLLKLKRNDNHDRKHKTYNSLRWKKKLNPPRNKSGIYYFQNLWPQHWYSAEVKQQFYGKQLLITSYTNLESKENSKASWEVKFKSELHKYAGNIQKWFFTIS
jgi:hypothetical protein